MSLIKKKWVQNTSIKVQVSISYTPEGTNTVSARLSGGGRTTITKVHAASVGAIALCTTPVESGGVAGCWTPEGPTKVSWVLEL
jgi:hypothetical protein